MLVRGHRLSRYGFILNRRAPLRPLVCRGVPPKPARPAVEGGGLIGPAPNPAGRIPGAVAFNVQSPLPVPRVLLLRTMAVSAEVAVGLPLNLHAA